MLMFAAVYFSKYVMSFIQADSYKLVVLFLVLIFFLNVGVRFFIQLLHHEIKNNRK